MKTNTVLGVLFGVQIGLIALTWLPTQGSNTIQTRDLLPFEADAVTAFSIARQPESGDRTPVTLEKKGEEWVLASAGGYPADISKVAPILEKLASLERGQRVATKATSHNKMKVGADDYGKWLSVTAGDQTAELFIGAARSNSVHARLADSNDVVLARGLSEWSLRDTARGYFDDAYLTLDPTTLTSFGIKNAQGSFLLTRSGDSWTLSTAEEPAPVLDQEAVSALITAAAKLRVAEPVGTDVLPEHGLQGGTVVQYTTEQEGLSTDGRYVLGASVDEQIYAKAHDNAFVIRTAKSQVSDVLDAALPDLLLAIEDDPT